MAVPIPAELASALREQRCVIVVGMQLVSMPLERHETGEPGLAKLVEVLEQLVRQQSNLGAAPQGSLRTPEDRLFRLAERYEAEEDLNPDDLLTAVRDYYKTVTPSELHRLVAQLGAPGMFYLHFDGLMDRACAEQNTPATVLRSVLEAPQTKDPPLVLVRGTLSDFVSDERGNNPLVLSEHEQLKLSDDLTRMHPTLESLARGHLRRVVLFLGTDPADPIARQLARKVLMGRTGKPVASFFVSCRHNPGDELFWRRFRSRFLPLETDAFVRAASALVKRP